MIFAHIAGLDDHGRQLLFAQAKQFAIVDLDEFTSKIVSDKNMSVMYDKLEYYNNMTKDPNNNKLQQKQFCTKARQFESKMNVYWKSKMTDSIERTLKLNSKNIILVGYSSYFKNHKAVVNVKATHKFFQKVDLTDHARNIVEYNIDNYRDEIIDGTFPLEFLNHDHIIKKRDSLTFQYKRMGYHTDTINNILNSLHIASSIPPPPTLYFASSHDFAKKLPLQENKLIAYADDWVAMVSAISNDKKSITKGFSSGKPFVKEMTAGGIQCLHKPLFLYSITNTAEFSPIASKGTVYKYLTNKPIAHHQKLAVDDVYQHLQQMDIKLQTI
jgi:hypothetical protein